MPSKEIKLGTQQAFLKGYNHQIDAFCCQHFKFPTMNSVPINIHNIKKCKLDVVVLKRLFSKYVHVLNKN